MRIGFGQLGLLALALTAGICFGGACSSEEKLSTGTSGIVMREAVGIETLGGVFTPLIPAGSELPARYSAIFSTAADDQPQIEVHVVAGTGDTVAENRSLARFIVADLRPAPRGVPQIEISLQVDNAGRLAVAARELDAPKRSLSVARSGAENDLTISVGPR